MFARLRTVWYWLTREKVPPTGHPRDIDVRHLPETVDRLRTDVEALNDAVDSLQDTASDNLRRLDGLTRAVEERDQRLGEVAWLLGRRIDDLEGQVAADWESAVEVLHNGLSAVSKRLKVKGQPRTVERTPDEAASAAKLAAPAPPPPTAEEEAKHILWWMRRGFTCDDIAALAAELTRWRAARQEGTA